MSATWRIFSPLSETELRAVADECVAHVEAYLDEHPECDDRWAEPVAGGDVPTVADVRATYHKYRLPLPDAIVDRLSKCRAALLLDKPGELDADQLQVSILKFLLERIGKGLILWNDHPLEATDLVRLELRTRAGAPGFGD